MAAARSLLAAGALLLAAGAAAAQTATCPPPGFDAVQNFDVERWIAAPWYVQAQEPLVYQPADELYCVRARYSPLDPADALAGLEVQNRCAVRKP
jgi:hypothetical protein